MSSGRSSRFAKSKNKYHIIVGDNALRERETKLVMTTSFEQEFRTDNPQRT